MILKGDPRLAQLQNLKTVHMPPKKEKEIDEFLLGIGTNHISFPVEPYADKRKGQSIP